MTDLTRNWLKDLPRNSTQNASPPKENSRFVLFAVSAKSVGLFLVARQFAVVDLVPKSLTVNVTLL